MFKKMCFFVTIISLLVSSVAVYGGNTNVYININGKRIYPDASPFIKDGRTLVPIRIIAENLGAEVDWNESTRDIAITLGSTSIKMSVGTKTATINGKLKTLDVPPQIYDSRTFVPIRFIAESMNMIVNWIPEIRLATVTSPDYFDNIYGKTVLGYSTNDFKGDTSSYNSLINNPDSIDSIVTFSYTADSKGNLNPIGQSQSNAVKFANDNGIRPLVLINNYIGESFDINLANKILSNETVRKNLIHNILLAMGREEYAGVNIDIEHINWYDRDNYSAFIKELKETLGPFGFLTTVSISAKTYDSYKLDNWSGAFDYAEIGKYADQIMLMTYDEHFATDVPGSISSLPWVENVVKYASSVIPSKKLLLGIAGYGYDWADTGTKVISLKDVPDFISKSGLTVQWDDTLKSPHFSYEKNGVAHEVWYENADSISYKYDLVNKYGLGGIGLWRLGYEDSVFWDITDRKIRQK